MKTVDMPRSEPITGPITQVLFKGGEVDVKGTVELVVLLVSEFMVGVGIVTDVEFEVVVVDAEVVKVDGAGDAFMADLDAIFGS